MTKTRFLEVKKSDLSASDVRKIIKVLTIKNPAFTRAKNMGQEIPPDMPPKLEVFQDTGTTLILPREIDSAEELKDIKWSPCNIIQPPSTPITMNWRRSMKLRPYQEEPIQKLVDGGSILNAECGSGKTVMCINALTRMKEKVAIVVDLEILMTQWRDALKQFTTLRDDQIGQVGLGVDKPSDVTICMIQTLLRREYKGNEDFYDSFPIAVFDECHSAGALEYFKVINRFPWRRIGLTATIERTDKLKTFIWSIGSNIVKVTSEKLVPIVEMLPTETYCPPKYFTFGYKVNDQVLRNILCKNKERTARTIGFVQKLVDDGRNVIVLTHRREHAKQLFDGIALVETDKAILVGSGKKGDGVNRIDADKPRLIVATFNFLHKGFDDDRMDAIVFTSPFGAKNTIQQAVGRILRTRDGKPTPLVFDIYDPKIDHCKSLADHRERTYKEFGYVISRPAI